MKINSSVKVALIGVGGLALAYGAYQGWHRMQVAGFELKQIAPGRVNLVAIAPEAGYRIVVSNRLAQLAEVTGDSFGKSDDEAEVTNAERLPIREYMAALQGDIKSLGLLIEKLNKLEEDLLPPTQVNWSAEDIQKALAGDAALIKKLEGDLNVTLDGKPLSTFSSRAIFNGIVILQDVSVKVNVNGELKTLTAQVRKPFQPGFSRNLEKALAEDNRFRESEQAVADKYLSLALPIIQGEQAGEDVRRALEARVSDASALELAAKPEQVLASGLVLLNDSHLKGAAGESYQTPNRQTLTDITLDLTDEGRMRLWKHSVENKGFQLLFIVDDIAIAAPRISTELAGGTVRITQVPDDKMAAAAVQTIKQISAS
jgi:hypothetical protein